MFHIAPRVPGQTVETHRLKELRSRVKELVGVSKLVFFFFIQHSSEFLERLCAEVTYI